MMDVLYPHCAGLDVHKRTVVACVCHTDGPCHAAFTPQTFGTTTPELFDLQASLQAEHVTHAAMEATGSYWNLVAAGFTTRVVNPAHMKNVPGRKTDVKDATWIADLLRHGLLTPSFIPDKPQRDLRELTHQRTQWLAERARNINLQGGHLLGHIGELTTRISLLDEIRVDPQEATIRLLCTIPGINRHTAEGHRGRIGDRHGPLSRCQSRGRVGR